MKQDKAYHRYKLNQEFRVVPQRFPHEDGADLGDNYIAGLFDNVNDPMTHATYADKFFKADEAPGVVHEKTPDIIRPFAGTYDRSLKLNDWTDSTQDRLKKAMRAPLRDPLFRRFLRDRRTRTRDYLRQWHPKARNLHATRSDRFPPLSKFPNKVPKAYGSVGDTRIPLGLPTAEEKALINGQLGEKDDPFALDATLGDTQKPAEEVLMDSQHNNFLHKQQGEPISDSLLADWDLQNGVADP